MIVKIEKIGMNGEGVFKVTEGEDEGKVGFVSYALSNEIVDVIIEKSKIKYCQATLNKIVESSIERKTPECPYFFKCGGCDIQHMSEDSQLEFKKNKAVETIKKIAKLDVSVNEIVHVNNYNYRNKMVFPFAIENGEIIIGMYKKSSHNVIDIDKCLLAENEINEILKLSKEYFKKASFTVYDSHTRLGVLKYLVIRKYENNFLITIVVNKRIDTKEFYKHIKQKFENIGISIIIGDSDDEILCGTYEYQYGLKKLEINEFGLKYFIDNRGFLQVNNAVKKIAYKKILDMINPQDVVIDAYSGAGLLSSIIAQKCKKVIGIEINSSASKSAVNMAKFNNLHNTMFYNDDVKNVLSKVLEENQNCVLILDPARSGCDDIVIEKILNTREIPKKIIYLSCNVATLSRDLNKLKSKYTLSNIEVFDMFPNTKHVEVLVVLDKN